MDERKNYYSLREIPRKGDLVKVVNHEFTYDGNKTIELYGIVVDENGQNNKQIKIFPEVQVYLLKTGKITSFPIGGVKIISKIPTSSPN